MLPPEPHEVQQGKLGRKPKHARKLHQQVTRLRRRQIGQGLHGA